MDKKIRRLFVIDANSLIHRAFHALPPLTTPEGENVGAVYGVASILMKILKDSPPDYVAAAFDRPETTLRKEAYEKYKAHRPKTPEDLLTQLGEARELFLKFGIRCFDKAGYEADDIIGSFVKRFSEEKNLEISILTGDLDTLQMVKKNVFVWAPQKGVSEMRIYDAQAVINRFHITPEQMTDYKGLVGDPSDNIPGVSGIGKKGAETILGEFGSIENAIKKMDDSHPLSKKLIPQKDIAILSKKLATLYLDIELNTNLKDLEFSGIKPESVLEYFKKLGFQSLLKRIGAETPEKEEIETKARIKKPYKIIPFSEKKQTISALRGAKEGVLVSYGWKEIFKSIDEKMRERIKIFFDVEIAAWLIDPSQKDYSPEGISKRFLRGVPREEKELLERLFIFLSKKIEDFGLSWVWNEIELPLIKILCEVEDFGILVDRKKLKYLSEKISGESAELQEKIYSLAGEEFNINSPKQVSEILFEKLNLGAGKNRKTKTGMKSTAGNILASMEKDHKIVEYILIFRENEKIQNTHILPLIELSRKGGKIHTTFVQTGTSTGRLSSEKPNLQNIPQESKWSEELRSSFISRRGFTFLSFDYSQLELRLLAHTTGDEKLRAAFLRGEDVHAITASQIFNIPISSVNKQTRRLAKTLNFGIMYGMGARAFGETSGISFNEAKKFINEYFFDFPKVKEWQEKTKAEARSLGYVKTESGRRRWFLNQPQNQRILSEIERAAINMPIQGFGADILKIAMIKGVDYLRGAGFYPEKARLILTIHDELIFEIHDDILESVAPLLKRITEEAYKISVPLIVETKTGKSLGEMESRNS